MSRIGAAPRAAVPVSNARAEASRRNGAKSRGPRTQEGKARSSRNALKHGLRAARHVLLPQEDAAEFAALEKALLAELAPVGALQIVLAQRIVIAAWRLARADRMEAEVLEFRSYEGAGAGLALIRDGNSTRTVEALLRYRAGAMAEFTRALRTLQALQAEPSRDQPAGTSRQPRSRARKPGGRVAQPSATGRRPAPPRPNQPEKAPKNNRLASQQAPIAAIPPARGANGAAACPEGSLESLIRPALGLLAAQAALGSQTNPTGRGASAT